MTPNQIKNAINSAANKNHCLYDNEGNLISDSWFPYFQNDNTVDICEMQPSKRYFCYSICFSDIQVRKNKIILNDAIYETTLTIEVNDFV